MTGDGERNGGFFLFLFPPDKSDMTSQITSSSRNNFLSLGEECPCPSLPECVGGAAFFNEGSFWYVNLGNKLI